MKWFPRLAYGCGQLLKDVVASVLSAFVIVYFQNCLGILPSHVGSLLLVGQVVNSISTPLIGFLSDRAVQLHTAADKVDDGVPSQVMKLKQFLKNHFSLHKRKSWHLWGSLLMGASFPTLFGLPQGMHLLPTWSKLMAAGILLIAIQITILETPQIGWASVQIAHLTLLNYLTSDPNEKVLLVSLRYSFGSIADISTFTLSYVLLLQGFTSPTPHSAGEGNYTEVSNLSVAALAPNGASLNQTQSESNKITPNDIPLFRSISLVLTAIGMLAVVIFQCLVPEGQVESQEDKINQNNESLPEDIQDVTRSHVHFIKSLDELHSISSQLHQLGQSRVMVQSCDAVDEDIPEEEPDKPAVVVSVKWYNWFRIPRFWLCCAIFTGMRMAASLSLLYLSPFLLEGLKLEKSNIVLIPLIAQCTTLVTTATQHLTTKLVGRLVSSLIGFALFLGYCGTIYFCEVGSNKLVIVAAILFGVGSAITNVTAIMVISDLIGSSQVQTAAFVNGFSSLTEKLATGVTLQLIQLALPTLTYRQIEVFIVGGCLTLTSILFILDQLFHGNQQADAPSEQPSQPPRSSVYKVEEEGHTTTLMNGEANGKNGRLIT